MKLLIAVPAEGSVPLLEFFGLLDEKQRQKLLFAFCPSPTISSGSHARALCQALLHRALPGAL